MGKGSRKPAATPDIERVSLGELIHEHVRVAIETAIHEELYVALGVRSYERHEARRGYRSGREDADTDRPERAADAPRAACDAVRRAGVDLGAPAPVSAAAARGERSDRRHVPGRREHAAGPRRPPPASPGPAPPEKARIRGRGHAQRRATRG